MHTGTRLRLDASIQRCGCAVSEQRKAVEGTDSRLAQSEESYRLLVEQAPEAIVVLDIDENRIIEANPSAEKLFGYARDELSQHDLPEFFASSQPDGRPIAESFQEHKTRAAAGETLAFERAIRTAVRVCEEPQKVASWA